MWETSCIQCGSKISNKNTKAGRCYVNMQISYDAGGEKCSVEAGEVLLNSASVSTSLA